MGEQFFEFLNSLRDRVKRPFYGAFIFSWCIVNWRLFLVVFSYDNTNCSGGIIQCIELSGYLKMKYMLCYPLIVTFIYSVVVPFLDLLKSYFDMKVIRNIYLRIKYGKNIKYTGLDIKLKDEIIVGLESRIESLNYIKELNKQLLEKQEEDRKKIGELNNLLQPKFDFFNPESFVGAWQFYGKVDPNSTFSDPSLLIIYLSGADLVIDEKIKGGSVKQWGRVIAYCVKHTNNYMFTILHQETIFAVLTLRNDAKDDWFYGDLRSPKESFRYSEVKMKPD
ncbi:MAG: hypothetical protein JNL57_06940 [Bacteroidetes bacterium]|nr:hypothetical protein [Bacteroidota bacterium]